MLSADLIRKEYPLNWKHGSACGPLYVTYSPVRYMEGSFFTLQLMKYASCYKLSDKVIEEACMGIIWTHTVHVTLVTRALNDTSKRNNLQHNH